MGSKMFYKCGFKKHDLIPVKCRMAAANREPLNILGAIFIRFSGSTEESKSITSGALTYVSTDTDKFYLSREVLKDLGVIDQNFPQIKPNMMSAGLENQATNGSEKFIGKDQLSTCGCLVRTKPPPRPDQLPFDCKEENIPKMRQWLLDRYASSTFNKCPHQTLPLMEGPPISILIDDEAKPV